MGRRYCKGCRADVTKHMMCICGEFQLNQGSTISEKDYVDLLITELMNHTFHHSDETAKPIVDSFAKHHPIVLNHYSMEQLYKF